MLSHVISLVLRDSDPDSENVSLIRLSVSIARKHAVRMCIIDRYIIKTNDMTQNALPHTIIARIDTIS